MLATNYVIWSMCWTRVAAVAPVGLTGNWMNILVKFLFHLFFLFVFVFQPGFKFRCWIDSTLDLIFIQNNIVFIMWT